MRKAVVLLSGGLDSSLNLFKAKEEFAEITTLTFDYGQRAAEKEIEAAKYLSGKTGCPHRVVALPFFKSFTKTSLIDIASEVPTEKVNIEDRAASEESAKAVWVPNRNGIFLNIAAGFAEGAGAGYVVPGFNREEASTFPDNSAEFCERLDRSFAYSTSNKVRVRCYTLGMDKTEMVAEALKRRLPIRRLWPCYFSGATWCGRCESCQRFERALNNNGLSMERLSREKDKEEGGR